MTVDTAWIAAFPLAEAAKAVQAVRESWVALAVKDRPGFSPLVDEPKLTRVLRKHTADVTGRALGLLGYWGTEGVENEVDFETGKILSETRTDILYAWNDDKRSLRLVFEFKKLNHTTSARERYLGEQGLRRFVTGPYGCGEAVAIMAGVLTVDEPAAVPLLQQALQHPTNVAALQLIRSPTGAWLHDPSVLFPSIADFDTEHTRPAALAPGHGTIWVAHLLLAFGYALPVPVRRHRIARDTAQVPQASPEGG